jgi:hypothetical protein
MSEESVSIDLIHNTEMDTYKIFLKPIETRSGDLGVRNLLKIWFLANQKHHGLFGKNVTTTNLPDGYEHYTITNIQGLFDKIFHVRRSPVTDVAFTYCYKSDGRIYLCKTDGPKDDDKCKHAWLCDKVKGIVAAGIMQFSKKNDTNIIYIDNMSGTYKTKPEDLSMLKEDFKNSFPGINIELLPSPGVITPETIYCAAMTSETVDYPKLCKNNLSTSGGRNKKSKNKSKKKSKNKSKKKSKKKQTKTQRKNKENFSYAI